MFQIFLGDLESRLRTTCAALNTSASVLSLSSPVALSTACALSILIVPPPPIWFGALISNSVNTKICRLQSERHNLYLESQQSCKWGSRRDFPSTVVESEMLLLEVRERRALQSWPKGKLVVLESGVLWVCGGHLTIPPIWRIRSTSVTHNLSSAASRACSRRIHGKGRIIFWRAVWESAHVSPHIITYVVLNKPNAPFSSGVILFSKIRWFGGVISFLSELVHSIANFSLIKLDQAS